MSLKVVTFADTIDERISVLKDSCERLGLPLEVLGQRGKWDRNAIKLKYLSEYLSQTNVDDKQCLLIVDAFDVDIMDGEASLIKAYEQFNTDVIFSAEANFYFREPTLRHYYWKHYFRGNTHYDYLNSGSFIGLAQHVKQMLGDIQALYGIDFSDEDVLSSIRSDQSLFSRFFADCSSQSFRPDYTIAVDRKQQLFACTGGRATAVSWPLLSKRHSFLFFQYERKLLKTFGLASQQTIFRDLVWKKDQLHNTATGTHPLVVHIPASREHFRRLLQQLKGKYTFNTTSLLKPLAAVVSFAAYLQSLVTLLQINRYNKGRSTQPQIFRYSKNYGPGYHESASRLRDLLEKKVPFCFSHLNDGEITFIRKYLNKDNEAKWYGRKQQIYSTVLAERLMTALKVKRHNYFVGVPCGTCYPELKTLALELRQADEFTVPAMTIHHNLSLLPAILGALRGRKLFFVLNEFQDLAVLKKLGLEVDEPRIMRVPFRNSYELYEELAEQRFEDGTVVMMMCGMLAKIVSPVWFENNPTCTFLAFGSSMDDLIQTDNIKYKLYPSEFPYTRNIFPYRSFLFGLKKPCPECFDLRDVS
ncbi:glycosyltransferase domain-containing protein [uncultured Imperialibacter sp.]|uniref:glycosyltransferase domain-containing protein n=1 Tax=uncultured Imperialibacter sp. TaxID=1672639 RepID=UPI0030DD6A44|tara:strand:- start:18166 stop:19923 length:1758 start_codon:yes stop_codon:yes gene_type:complete